MVFGNESQFQESLSRFAAFAKTDDYVVEERQYKEEMIASLGAALSDTALDSPDVLANLQAAVKSSYESICNIAHWTDADDLRKYLDSVPANRIRDLLRSLFDEDVSINDRINVFKKAMDADYAEYANSQKNHIRLGLVSILLAARDPQRYVFYRPSIIKSAEKNWGIQIPKANSEGVKYVQYMEFVETVKDRLSEALERPADGIDTHSFMWRSHVVNAEWKDKLQEWLKRNKRTMPESDQELLTAFQRKFPKESLGNLALDGYALSGNNDSFCYWIEFKTKSLGDIRGATSAKHGVWWDSGQQNWRFTKNYSDEVQAFDDMKSGILALIRGVESGDFAALDSADNPLYGKRTPRGKILYLYFADQFLPIYQTEHIKKFMKLFGEVDATGDLVALNRRLLEVMRSQPEFEGFDSLQMMKFLYDAFSPKNVESDLGDPVDLPDSCSGS